MAWASATLALGVVGLGLGRLEALPRERFAKSPSGDSSQREGSCLQPEPAVQRPALAPLPRDPSRSASPRETPSDIPRPNSTLRPRACAARLWVPPPVDPDALRLVQLLRAFCPPTGPTLDPIADLLLPELQEEEQLAFLFALSRSQDVSALCESHTSSAAALPLLLALYSENPNQAHRDLILALLGYVDFEDLDPKLLAVLARDWPQDERVSAFQELRRQALTALPATSLADLMPTNEAGPEGEPVETESRDPDPYAVFEIATLDEFLDAHEEDPAPLMAWLSTKTSPRWASLRLLLRVVAAPWTAPDDEAFRRLQDGQWRHLDPGHLVDFVALLERASGPLELQLLALKRLARDKKLDLQALSSQVSARSKFLLALVSQELLGSDLTPLSALDDYTGLLEEEPFVARRLLPRLWEVQPRLRLSDAIVLADAFQRAGDPRLADEVLRHCEQGPWLAAARDHLAEGHSLGQYREWALFHDR